MVDNRSQPAASGRAGIWAARILGGLLGLIGLWLAGGGAWLLSLGGSPYYLIAGLGCLIAAFCYLSRREGAGTIVYLAVFLGTCLWAFGEVGSDFWQLVPRVVGPAVFAAVAVILWLFARPGKRIAAWALTGVAVVGFAAFMIGITRLPALEPGSAVAPGAAAAEDWIAFGRDPGGARHSLAAQITPANVGQLEVAWTLRTGDLRAPGEKAAYAFEATPLKIGDTLYFCTPHNTVVAADADSGAIRWRFDPKLRPGAGMLACRGVAYHQAEGSQLCARRILLGTLDARLMAIDAATGKLCPDFGVDGTVALGEGLSSKVDRYYRLTSPPTVINGIAVIGGFVLDGSETNEPSGVIRGYDAVTGKLAWSWDSGAKDENWRPGPGEHYTPGSPNSWTVMSRDPELGLVYVPMGNATPDYVGMHRTPEHGRYSSAVVALDSRTGVRRWHFQTVHHDLWDYDLGSQPVLFDMPMPGGGTVAALAQPTKQGDIYILDRATGKPLTEVIERPVPRGSVPHETYSPTQPVSTGFPSALGKEVLVEKDMWGATPLDQLFCRIRFRSANYTGRYTPPSTRMTIEYPSNFGVVDWGSVSIGNGMMYVNSSHIPMTLQLIPQAEIDKRGAPKDNKMFSPQKGTAYAADPRMMLSPLGIPCNAPPWGRLTGIDLATRKIAWQRPLGTTHDLAPAGIAVPGSLNIAGSVSTAGGLVFIGATTDDYLRAFDSRTGHEVWRARLPAGGQAAPISYVSLRTGRQYIVIAAGGHQPLGTRPGDYVVAYALPRAGK